MPCGIIKLNKRGRKLLALTISLINLIQITIGLCLCIVGLYIIKNVGTKLFSECAEIAFVYSVIAMYGVNVTFQYIMGLIICHKCYKKSAKKSTGRLLGVWALSACNTVLNGIIFACLSSKIAKHIIKSIKYALKRGMEEYLTDLTWKVAFDTLQQYSQCCGIKSARDWIENAWIFTKLVNNTNISENQIKKKSYSLIKLPVMPWSCCKINYPLPCFHDRFQQNISQNSFHYKMPNDSINSAGCLHILIHPIEISLQVIIYVNTTLLFLQILTLVLIRILYTASKNATILGECEETKSPGWLYGPNKKRYAETLRELMRITSLDFKKNVQKNIRNEELNDRCSELQKLLPTENSSDTSTGSGRLNIKKNKNGSILIVCSEDEISIQVE